ncbi:MAG: hypothetical protein M1830_010104 [Pleopsidium flavum]|nr:MAG: hypothetical protein M1830_010104 [Pleopsidium flavum]
MKLSCLVPFLLSLTPLIHGRAIIAGHSLTGKHLRILPLGASITNGFGSTDGNGYRLDLVKDLAGNTVKMIGSLKSGTMSNNENEGHGGAVINQVASYAKASLKKRPNVVLLHVGTNDMHSPTDRDTAPDRLGSLVDEIVAACPDAAVLVAEIIPAANADTESRIVKFNNAICGMVEQRAKAGKHVMAVDMSASLTTADLSPDGVHPGDKGYKKMADAWFAGLEKVNDLGWITDPVTVS